MDPFVKFGIGLSLVIAVIIALAVYQILEFRWNQLHYKKMNKKHVKNMENIVAVYLSMLLLWFAFSSFMFKHLNFVWHILAVSAITVLLLDVPVVLENFKIDKERGYGVITAKYLRKMKLAKQKK